MASSGAGSSDPGANVPRGKNFADMVPADRRGDVVVALRAMVWPFN